MPSRSRPVLLAILVSILGITPLVGNPSGLASLSSLFGLSGKIRAVFAMPRVAPGPALEPAPAEPGVYALPGITETLGDFRLIVLTPFSAKVRGRIGPYRMGYWPSEGRSIERPRYETPKGFIEVTPENWNTRISEHFTLGEFVTKDQQDVWPKYLVLDRRLIDKLELTLAELERRGYAIPDLVVMSGFRTPQYNERGVGAGGRSSISRHQYGDAADVFSSAFGGGRAADINRDGRSDLRDAKILAEAAESVEASQPELVGGIGIYPATSAHPPFVHIDARGKRARWGPSA